MRDYGRVSPKFWTGQTGKKIRALGRDAQVVALYLMTNPHTNYLGLYYLPIPFLCHEVGIDEEGASEALASLYEAGFADYDPDSEHVWVYEMMRFQVADELKANDNRIKGINAAYMALPNNPFLREFFDKYHENFHLETAREPDSKARAFQGASKALRSQEQEQEHEQEQENNRPDAGAASNGHDDDPMFLALPCLKNKTYPITESLVAEYEDDFPAVDVRQELRNAVAWVKANPKKKKTYSGARRFLTGWLTRSQNRGGSKSEPAQTGPRLQEL